MSIHDWRNKYDSELSGMLGLYKHAHQDFQPYLYAAIRELDAVTVVETGVNIGISTYFALHALAKNSGGDPATENTLYSCDPMWHNVSAAIGRFSMMGWKPPKGARWVFSSRRSEHYLHEVPIEPVWDIFIHDSDHSPENIRRELEFAWPLVRPGGLIFVDDFEDNKATSDFLETLASVSVDAADELDEDGWPQIDYAYDIIQDVGRDKKKRNKTMVIYKPATNKRYEEFKGVATIGVGRTAIGRDDDSDVWTAQDLRRVEEKAEELKDFFDEENSKDERDADDQQS